METWKAESHCTCCQVCSYSSRVRVSINIGRAIPFYKGSSVHSLDFAGEQVSWPLFSHSLDKEGDITMTQRLHTPDASLNLLSVKFRSPQEQTPCPEYRVPLLREGAVARHLVKSHFPEITPSKEVVHRLYTRSGKRHCSSSWPSGGPENSNVMQIRWTRAFS